MIGYIGDPWFRASLAGDCPDDTRPLHIRNDQHMMLGCDAVLMHSQWPDDDECGMASGITWRNNRAYPTADFTRFHERMRGLKIPFVWWDMEGGTQHAAFEAFEDTADLLFSTGTNAAGQPLPFAASPNLFPVGAHRAPRSVMFAGRAYRDRWPVRLAWLRHLVRAADERGWQMTIRTWQDRDDWPPEWKPMLRKSIPYEALGHHVGQYLVGANHNLVDDDPTMCSMRLPALAMTGTPVITNRGGLADSLHEAGGAWLVESATGCRKALDDLLQPAEWLFMSDAARKWALESHTWRHRIDTIAGKL